MDQRSKVNSTRCSRARPLTLSLGAAALALALWWLWPKGPEAPVASAVVPTEPAASDSTHTPERDTSARASVEASARAPSEPEAPQSAAAAGPESAALDAELAAEVEPGAIEGLVLRGQTPVDGGTVYFWPGHWRSLPADPGVALGHTQEGALETRPIGPDGRFRIAPLDPDWYTLGVDSGAGVGAQLYLQILGDKPSRRVVIVLGTARVAGFVYDGDGRPVEGAAVRVTTKAHERELEHYAESAGDGSYTIDDLWPGDYWIALDRAGRRGIEAGVDEMRQLTGLVDGETRRIDFGSPQRGVVWRGRIVTRGGEAVTLSGDLGHARTSDDAYSEVAVDSGAFELRLQPGMYRMQVKLTTSAAGYSTGYLALGTHEVGASDFQRDLALPGAAVAGRVVGLAELPAKLTVTLRDAEGRPRHHSRVQPDGSYRFVSVEPGEWRASAWTTQHTFGELPFTVLESDTQLALDVPVQGP